MSNTKEFLKMVSPSVVKLVGSNAAMLFQHISYWMQSSNTDVIYRSASSFISDLGDSLTRNQLYYARNKLIKAGLITVSTEHSDKFNRTTFYKITEKGQSLRIIAKQSQNTSQNQFKSIPAKQEGVSNVEINKTPSSEVKAPESLKNDVVIDLSIDDNSKTTCIEGMKIDLSLGCDENLFVSNKVKSEHNTSQKWTPKHLYAQHMKEKRVLEQQNKEFFIPKSMRESFETAGEIRRDVVKGIPKELLSDPRLSKMLKKHVKVNNRGS